MLKTVSWKESKLGAYLSYSKKIEGSKLSLIKKIAENLILIHEELTWYIYK